MRLVSGNLMRSYEMFDGVLSRCEKWGDEGSYIRTGGRKERRAMTIAITVALEVARGEILWDIVSDNRVLLLYACSILGISTSFYLSNLEAASPGTRTNLIPHTSIT